MGVSPCLVINHETVLKMNACQTFSFPLCTGQQERESCESHEVTGSFIFLPALANVGFSPDIVYMFRSDADKDPYQGNNPLVALDYGDYKFLLLILTCTSLI